VCPERLDTSLSGVLVINNLVRKTMLFCSAGTSPREPKSTVKSRLDVTDVQNRKDVLWNGGVERAGWMLGKCFYSA
jgi:hypothetical protein